MTLQLPIQYTPEVAAAMSAAEAEALLAAGTFGTQSDTERSELEAGC